MLQQWNAVKRIINEDSLVELTEIATIEFNELEKKAYSSQFRSFSKALKHDTVHALAEAHNSDARISPASVSFPEHAQVVLAYLREEDHKAMGRPDLGSYCLGPDEGLKTQQMRLEGLLREMMKRKLSLPDLKDPYLDMRLSYPDTSSKQKREEYVAKNVNLSMMERFVSNNTQEAREIKGRKQYQYFEMSYKGLNMTIGYDSSIGKVIVNLSGTKTPREFFRDFSTLQGAIPRMSMGTRGGGFNQSYSPSKNPTTSYTASISINSNGNQTLELNLNYQVSPKSIRKLDFLFD